MTLHTLIQEIEILNEGKVYSLIKAYDKYNALLFDGELPKIKLKYSKTLKTTARLSTKYTYTDETKDTVESYEYLHITVNNKYELTPIEIDGFLIHEMVHVWMAENGYYEHINVEYHGKEFKSKLKEVAAKVEFNVPLIDTRLTKKLANKNTKDFGIIILHNKPYDVYGIFVIDAAVMKKNIEVMERMLQSNVTEQTEYYLGYSNHPEITQFKQKRTYRKISFEGLHGDLTDIYKTMDKVTKVTYQE